uniref:Mitochondrial Rho GTPase 2 n=1 Tax=Gadus morhua TaxID=8049 RepID=A0A8C5AWW3_GADMO
PALHLSPQVLREEPEEHLRAVLLRPEGRAAPHGAALRPRGQAGQWSHRPGAGQVSGPTDRGLVRSVVLTDRGLVSGPHRPGAGQWSHRPGAGQWSHRPGAGQWSHRPGAGQVSGPHRPGAGQWSHRPGAGQVSGPHRPGAGQWSHRPGAGQVSGPHRPGLVRSVVPQTGGWSGQWSHRPGAGQWSSQTGGWSVVLTDRGLVRSVVLTDRGWSGQWSHRPGAGQVSGPHRPGAGQWSSQTGGWSGQWSLRPGAGQWSSQTGGWSGQWSHRPGAGQWSLRPGAGQWSLRPGAGQWSHRPGAGQWSHRPGAGQWSSQTGGWSVVPQTGGWSVVPQTGGWSVVPQTGGWSVVPQTGGWSVVLTDRGLVRSVVLTDQGWSEVTQCFRLVPDWTLWRWSVRPSVNLAPVPCSSAHADDHFLFPPPLSQLKPQCVRALSRIFYISDRDNDRILSDVELNRFQKACFGNPLAPQALEDVKTVVWKNTSDGVQDNGLTLNGFLFLNTLFIQRGRHETTWTILRSYGYDDTLELTDDYLYPPLRVPAGCTTEINHLGHQFLQRLFDKYDEDKDSALSPGELRNLFCVFPYTPWGPEVFSSVPTTDQGYLSHHGYLCQWTLSAYLDIHRCLEYLGYLGYPILAEQDSQTTAVTVTQQKELDLAQSQTQRTVFLCKVIGPRGTGKTAFLQAFVGRNIVLHGTGSHALSPYTINKVTVNNQERFLILYEVDVETEFLKASHASCDVACLMYDASDPQSFDYCASIYKQHYMSSQVPCVLVSSKADLAEVKQLHGTTPAQFCYKHRLPPPMAFSVLSPDASADAIYTKLAWAAMFPHLNGSELSGSFWLRVALGAAAAALLGVALYRTAGRHK